MNRQLPVLALIATLVTGCAAAQKKQVIEVGVNCPHPTARRYSMLGQLIPSKKGINVKAKIRLTCLPAGTLSFRINRGLKLDKVWVRGEVKAHKKVSQSESTGLATYQVASGKGARGDAELEFHYNGGIEVGEAQGMIAIQPEIVELRPEMGWYPLFDAMQEKFDAKLDFEYPASFGLVYQGKTVGSKAQVGARQLTRVDTEGKRMGTQKLAWQTTWPTTGLALLASEKLKHRYETETEISYSEKINHKWIEKYLAQVQQGLIGMQRLFSHRAGRRTVRLVFLDREGASYSLPGYVVFAAIPKDMLKDPVAAQTRVLAALRQLARFWMNMADTGDSSDWINISLCEYIAIHGLGSVFGVGSREGWFQRYRKLLEEQNMARPLVELGPADRASFARRRGALFWHALAKKVGKDEMLEFIRGLVTEQGRGVKTGTNVLLERMTSNFDGVEPIIKAWLKATPLPK